MRFTSNVEEGKPGTVRELYQGHGICNSILCNNSGIEVWKEFKGHFRKEKQNVPRQRCLKTAQPL